MPQSSSNRILLSPHLSDFKYRRHKRWTVIFSYFQNMKVFLFQQRPSQDKRRLSVSEGSSNFSPSHPGPPKTLVSKGATAIWSGDVMCHRHNKISDSVVKNSFDILLVRVCKWILLTQSRENISYGWLYFKPPLLSRVTLIQSVL